MEHVIRSRFDFGDKVFFAGHDDPEPGFVIGFLVSPALQMKIIVQWDKIMDNAHYEWELTQKDPEGEISGLGGGADLY